LAAGKFVESSAKSAKLRAGKTGYALKRLGIQEFTQEI
jgi:hypothetical protein